MPFLERLRKQRKRQLFGGLGLFVLIAFAVFAMGIFHPCRRRLSSITATLKEIWQEPETIARLKTAEEYEQILRKRVRVPLACPLNPNQTYQFFPTADIVLADIHAEGKGFAIQYRWRLGKVSFRVTAWSLLDPKANAVTPVTSPSFFQQLLETLFGWTETLFWWIDLVFPDSPRLVDGCPNRLQNVVMALLQYVQDYDERFPPMHNEALLQDLLYPYIRNPQVFFCPLTRHDYQPNPNLSYRHLWDIMEPAKTPVLHDAVLHPDGGRMTAFTSGHAKLVLPSEWQQLQPYYRFPHRSHP